MNLNFGFNFNVICNQMEINETGGEIEGTLEFDFLFDDEVDLLTSQETTEIPSNQQNETAANISTVRF